jgi:hypothetical protein
MSVTYLLISVIVIIVVRRRRQRSAWNQYLQAAPLTLRRGGDPGPPGYEASIRGATPGAPLPAWMCSR